ncbi:MAG: hypothetical protein ACI8QU_001426 [Devosia litorisediminis]
MAILDRKATGLSWTSTIYCNATSLPANLSQLNPDVLSTGIEKCQVDLGLEQDPGKRFALWALLHMLSSAPDLDATFESEDDRNAARTFMELLEASGA